MKIIKRFITVLVFILILLRVLLCSLELIEHQVYDDYLEYHDYNNYSNVECVKIEYQTYSGEPLDKKYVQPDGIKKILKKIKRINFYKDPEESPLQESPTERITISYKDGTEKEIWFAGGIVLINKGIFGSDSYEVKTYFVGLVEKGKFFHTLPRGK